MKKNLLFIILLVIVVIPFRVEAISISGASISSTVGEQEVGSYFYVPFQVSFSGLGNNSGDSSGIYMVALSIEVDTEVLEITNIVSDFYDSVIYIDANTYYVLSIVDPDSTGNKCKDKFLACTDYKANIRFHLKDGVTSNSTDIKLTEVAAGVFEIDETLNSYSVDNMLELGFNNVVTRTIKIKKAEAGSQNQPKEEKNTVIESAKPEIKNDTIQTTKEKADVSSNSSNNSNKKSDNAKLKNITIENYKIDFKSDQFNYDITVDNKVESLNVIVETEDEKATYQIIGANSLEEEIRIIVKAENGNEQIYTIKINKEMLNNENISQNSDKKEKDKKIENLDQIIICGAGAIVFILIIVFIISRHNSKKIDKMLDNL